MFGGVPAKAVERAIREDVWVSPLVRAEWLALADRLGRKLKPDQLLALKARLLALLATANEAAVTRSVNLCRDPADDAYLSLALAARADILLTGDQDLLDLAPALLKRAGLSHLSIVSPREFLGHPRGGGKLH